jgi:hypothetical protein
MIRHGGHIQDAIAVNPARRRRRRRGRGTKADGHDSSGRKANYNRDEDEREEGINKNRQRKKGGEENRKKKKKKQIRSDSLLEFLPRSDSSRKKKDARLIHSHSSELAGPSLRRASREISSGPIAQESRSFKITNPSRI